LQRSWKKATKTVFIFKKNQKMPQKLRYRLALDLGSTSLGWAMIRLNSNNEPNAIIKAGVRIFSDGRNPKDGSSLAVTRRAARAMRRRRDRLLKRKARMTDMLLRHGFFPKEEAARKALELLNPYELRAKGLDAALKPEEFARALFHINQRRGFKSNRKTDKKDNDSGALKQAIIGLRSQLDKAGADGKARTVGELLHRRLQEKAGVRARYRETATIKDDGKRKIDKSYDLYIDRQMIEDEFDALWAKQSSLNPSIFTSNARDDLKDALLHQRPLKPVKAGRCTLMPEEERAPLALPSTQRARILQEVNHLRVLREGLQQEPLTLQQRNDLVAALEANPKRSFTQIKKLLGLGGTVQFNFEDPKRQELKGNVTSAILSKPEHFGKAWFEFSEAKQDEIVLQLVKEESESALVRWLLEHADIHEAQAEVIASVVLPEGYGSLCLNALQRIILALREDVIPYSEAVVRAGFEHHSQLNPSASGEILLELPYYGYPLRRFVAFGTGKPSDPPEKQFGKIANPTVHIGLNQVRTVVNALIERYGHPSQVIVEVARELKQSKEQRDEANRKQAENQKRNERIRQQIAKTLNISEQRVRRTDIDKWILWEELSFDVADRRCPYSGEQIGAHMLLSEKVEIEHILPFSQTLDDSLNNKTVALRAANRIKGNRTPWQARDDFEKSGWSYDGILLRAERMPRNKRYRFAHDGYEQWLKKDQDFLARALNDTRYMSRVAREYVSLICPQGTRVIPGQMTAMLRAKFGLNDILGVTGEKNRNDHRHHAVDACVIGVTDQGLMQRFAMASADARDKALDKLVESMPDPWPNYRGHVERAVNAIIVSHKPDHGYEGAMMEETSYGIQRDGSIRQKRKADGSEGREVSNLIRLSEPNQPKRHGVGADGAPLPYKGYIGGSNYCIEITRDEKGKWQGDVISTFRAYEIIRKGGLKQLRHPILGQNGVPLVMRLVIDDVVKMEVDGQEQLMRFVKVSANNGQMVFAQLQEANVNERNSDKTDSFSYTTKYAGSLQKTKARRVTISPIGELRDPGFKE
jgi:CRISPR-associated endonuclease Csn1